MAGTTQNFGKVTKTVTAAGTAEPIMASTNPDRYVVDFEVYVPSANAGAAMYIGDSTVDNTWIPRAKGSITNFVAANGDVDADFSYDLSQIYVDAASNGDAIIVQYRKTTFS